MLLTKKQRRSQALIESIDNPYNRKVLGIVAMLDVDFAIMNGLMDSEELQFVAVGHN